MYACMLHLQHMHAELQTLPFRMWACSFGIQRKCKVEQEKLVPLGSEGFALEGAIS